MEQGFDDQTKAEFAVYVLHQRFRFAGFEETGEEMRE
jgi:hypothetical protein